MRAPDDLAVEEARLDIPGAPSAGDSHVEFGITLVSWTARTVRSPARRLGYGERNEVDSGRP